MVTWECVVVRSTLSSCSSISARRRTDAEPGDDCRAALYAYRLTIVVPEPLDDLWPVTSDPVTHSSVRLQSNNSSPRTTRWPLTQWHTALYAYRLTTVVPEPLDDLWPVTSDPVTHSSVRLQSNNSSPRTTRWLLEFEPEKFRPQYKVHKNFYGWG